MQRRTPSTRCPFPDSVLVLKPFWTGPHGHTEMPTTPGKDLNGTDSLMMKHPFLYSAFQLLNIFKGSKSLPFAAQPGSFSASQRLPSLFLYLLCIVVKFHLAILSATKNPVQRRAGRDKAKSKEMQVRQHQTEINGCCSWLEGTP